MAADLALVPATTPTTAVGAGAFDPGAFDTDAFDTEAFDFGTLAAADLALVPGSGDGPLQLVPA